ARRAKPTPLLGSEGEAEDCERGEDCALGAKNILAKRGFDEPGSAGARDFVVGPAALRADREPHRRPFRATKYVPQRSRLTPLGEQNFQRSRGFCKRGRRANGAVPAAHNRWPKSARLLRGFEDDLLPPGVPFPRRRDQRLICASCS